MRAFRKMQELKNKEKGITSWSSKSVLSHTVNLRPRTKAELPISDRTVGNMVWLAVAVTQQSLAPDLGFLSGKISEAIAKIDTSFSDKLRGEEAEAKLAVLESLKDSITPLPSRIAFTSWCKLGFYDVDFGWGKPVWIGGLAVKVAAFYNAVVLMETRDGRGIEAWVTTDEPELDVLVSDPEIVRYALVDPSPLHEFC
uniref:Uncharacterized protein n=1 Tax=Kalanchoe fedtschenkoi TaxID=63787 RepID=A0A7N0VE78_KALFE